jgi:hypothetical protein
VLHGVSVVLNLPFGAFELVGKVIVAEMPKADKMGAFDAFSLERARIGVRPVARSLYFASRASHTTSFPLEKRR